MDGPQRRLDDPDQYVFRPDQARRRAARRSSARPRTGTVRTSSTRSCATTRRKRLIAARFIARKLWEFFAYPARPAGVVDALADVLLANNLELRPLLRALLTRPEFYAPTAKQGLVRTPDRVGRRARSYHTGIRVDEIGATVELGERMGQVLFNPPNVVGLEAQRVLAEHQRAQRRAPTCARQRRRGSCATTAASTTSTTMSVADAVDHVAGVLRLAPLSAATRDALIAAQQAERVGGEVDELVGRRRTC